MFTETLSLYVYARNNILLQKVPKLIIPCNQVYHRQEYAVEQLFTMYPYDRIPYSGRTISRNDFDQIGIDFCRDSHDSFQHDDNPPFFLAANLHEYTFNPVKSPSVYTHTSSFL